MILGITGISGSGKHTTAQILEKRGWVILDADKIAHLSYRPYTSVWKGIVKEFGEGILNQDDSINRLKLGAIVFNKMDTESAEVALRKLNQITHPYVKRKIKDAIHRHFRRGSDIAVVVALWKETDIENYCQKMLLVKADLESRLYRTKKRDGISEETYTMRIKNQTEPKNPDFVIENNKGIKELSEAINALAEQLEKNNS